MNCPGSGRMDSSQTSLRRKGVLYWQGDNRLEDKMTLASVIFLLVSSVIVHRFIHSTNIYGAPIVCQTLNWAQQRVQIWVKYILPSRISRYSGCDSEHPMMAGCDKCYNRLVTKELEDS